MTFVVKMDSGGRPRNDVRFEKLIAGSSPVYGSEPARRTPEGRQDNDGSVGSSEFKSYVELDFQVSALRFLR